MPPKEPDQQIDINEREDMLLPGEHVVTTIRKTVIGLILIYIEVLVAVAAVAAVFILAFPDLFSNRTGSQYAKATLVTVLLIAAVIFILFVVTYIYRQSYIIVTNRSLIQILQKTLFIRKVSRLSLADVEDVTAEQRGVLQSLFNYGTLHIETAGERENFVFPYCPNPNLYAEEILEDRQRLQENDNA